MMTEEDQLEAMKEQADDLGVDYAWNIGLDTLTERVEEALIEKAMPEKDEGSTELTGAQALALTGDY